MSRIGDYQIKFISWVSQSAQKLNLKVKIL